jgi:hypothetical protein
VISFVFRRPYSPLRVTSGVETVLVIVDHRKQHFAVLRRMMLHKVLSEISSPRRILEAKVQPVFKRTEVMRSLWVKSIKISTLREAKSAGSAFSRDSTSEIRSLLQTGAIE